MPGENFRAAGSPPGKSAKHKAAPTMMNSPSLNDPWNNDSDSTVVVQAQSGSSRNIDIYPAAGQSSYSSYRIPDTNPRIGNSSMDISSVGAPDSPSVTHLRSHIQQNSSSNMAQAMLHSVSLQQRDASNDVPNLVVSIFQLDLLIFCQVFNLNTHLRLSWGLTPSRGYHEILKENAVQPTSSLAKPVCLGLGTHKLVKWIKGDLIYLLIGPVTWMYVRPNFQMGSNYVKLFSVAS